MSSKPDLEPKYESDPDVTQAGVHATQPIFNEAPAVVFTQLYGAKGGQVVQFNLTIRANTGAEAINGLLDAIKYAENLKLSTVRPDMSIPAPTNKCADNTPAPAAGPAPVALSTPALVAPASISPPPGGAGNIIHAVKMKVTPVEDDKVRLEWFAPGHNYADISKVCFEDKALDLLAKTGPWDYSHLAKVNTYQVAHTIAWVQGKPNSKGGYYKDIVSVSA